MKLHNWIGPCLVLALTSHLALAQAQQTIEVTLGQQKTISVPQGSQITIGDPAIITARALPNQREIIITGRSEGVTSLTVYLPGGGTQERLIRVLQKDPQMISVDVEVIEITRSNGTEFNDGTLPDNNFSLLSEIGKLPHYSFGVDVNILERIAYWKSQGVATVVANPTLAVTNGDTAIFLAGGEVPIIYNVGQGTVAIEYKEYGTRLKVVPRLTGSGKIMLDITAEVSSLDLSREASRTGAPGLLSRRVASKGLVASGETVAIAGLYQRTMTENKRRVPILGHLLPWLFSSTHKSEGVSELIVLVTPKTPADIQLQDYPMLEKELQSSKEGQ